LFYFYAKEIQQEFFGNDLNHGNGTISKNLVVIFNIDSRGSAIFNLFAYSEKE